MWRWKKAFSTSLVVHRPHPYVIALLLELPLTKKKRETNEFVEGQVWSFGAIQFFLDLYKTKILQLEWAIWRRHIGWQWAMRFERIFFMKVFVHGNKPNQNEVKCVNNIIERKASLALAPKLWNGFGMIKWVTFLLELQRPMDMGEDIHPS